MLKIGISSCGGKGLTKENFSLMKKSGIDAIEISTANYKDLDYKALKQAADECGMVIWSFHLPFLPFKELDPASLDAEKSKYTFDTLIDIIKRGTNVGIDKYVIHPSMEPIPEAERPQRLKAAADFLSLLADEAAKFGCVIAVEDLPRTCLGNCSDDILYFLSANDKLRVCFDTNHLLGEKNTDFIKKVGSKIITLHVSDYDFVNERHWLPGEGDCNWEEIYNALIEVGYNGVWLYEIDLLPSKTIDRRVLEYSDFYKNANEIFSRKAPTPVGERKPNLGMWEPK